MKKILKLSLLLLTITSGKAFCQESIDLGRRHTRHVESDTLDHAPTSFEYFKRYEFEASGGQAYAVVPQNALSKNEVRGTGANNFGKSLALKLSCYLKPRLNVGVSVNWDKLGYSFQFTGSSINNRLDFAVPATAYGVFAKYWLGRIYVEGSAGYIVISDYRTAADEASFLQPLRRRKDPKGFAPGCGLGYRQPLKGGHISLIADAGIRWMMTDDCKGHYYTGNIGFSYRFREHQVVHED